MVLRGKVNVVFIGRRVHARLEIHTRQVQVVPPVPSHLAGLDPRRVTDAARRSQPLRHVAVQDVRIAGGNHHGTPRQRPRTTELRNVRLALRRYEVQTVVASDNGRLRIRCKLCRETMLTVLLEHHAGIVLHAGIHHNGLQPVLLADGQRGNG